MAGWIDIFKLWSFAMKDDPLTQSERARTIEGEGVTQPDVIPDIRSDGSFWGGGSGQVVRLRDSNDFIDLSSVTNRQSRYKEYERLRNTPEIETAMTVYADESCVAGNTLVQTPLGPISISKLAKTKKPEELFMVYCYNFEKEDFDIGWAFNPRKTGTKETLRITFNDGSTLLCTPDHKILKRNQEWIEAQNLKERDSVMAFWRVRPTVTRTNNGVRFAKIFTYNSSFRNERNLIDEFRTGLKTEDTKVLEKVMHGMQKGLSYKDAIIAYKENPHKIRTKLEEIEFIQPRQITKMHRRFPDKKRIIDIRKGPTIDVYDLSVKDHRNFCTDSAVVHNCQIGDNNHTFEIRTKSKAIREELEFLFFHPRMLNVDRKMFSWAKNLYCMGDFFLELVIDPDNPTDGILKVQELPPDSVYRIETIKGRLIEFQQSKEGPDYEALSSVEVTQATDQELMQSNALRFNPNQIVHFRIGDSRKTFYPYGVSLIEPARGPAHLLRLLEDSMVVYRLCLHPRTRLWTTFGPKRISDISLGDTVFSYDNGSLVPSQVTRIDINKGKPIFKVRTKRRVIFATGDHPFLTLDENNKEKYVEAANLKKQNCSIVVAPALTEGTPKKIDRKIVGFFGKLTEEQKQIFRTRKYKNKSQMIRDVMKSFNIRPIRSRMLRRWAWLGSKKECHMQLEEARELARVFDLGPPTICGYSERKNSPKFVVPEFMNEDIAKLLGFLIASGKIHYHNKRKTSGSVSVKATKFWSKDYIDIAVRSFGRKPEAKSPLKITSIDSVIILESIGLTNTKEKKDKERYQFPEWIWNERLEIRKAFALGFAEGFGRVRFFKGEWHCYLMTKEPKVLNDLKTLWESCGLTCGKPHRKRKIKRIRVCKWFYRKRTVQNGFGMILNKKPIQITEKVLRVDYRKGCDTFDISVSHRTENFIAEGAVVHNSRAPERRAFFIDVGQLPPFRAEALMQRMQDSLRKKKTFNSHSASINGASPVEERFQPIGADEDIFIPIRPNTNTRIETLPGACLALDTQIPLLDGRTLKLSEIIEEWNNGKTLWAYSCCPKTGKPAPGLITWAGITRKNTDVVKVTFDNGESIVCTPDHHFPIQEKGKIQAKDLQVGDSIFPFKKRLENLQPNRKSKYFQIYNCYKKKWEFVHRIIFNEIRNTKYENIFEYSEKFKGEPKNVIHHINYNHLDNCPTNLAFMNWDDHVLLHKDNQEITNKNISTSLKKYHNNLSEIEKQKRNEILAERSKIGTAKMQELLTNNEKFNENFRKKQSEGWAKQRELQSETYINHSKKITERNNEFWSIPENKQKVFEKQTVKYPQPIFDSLCNALKNKTQIKNWLIELSNSPELIKILVDENKHLVRKNINLENGLNPEQTLKMIKHYGYSSVSELRKHLGGEKDTTGLGRNKIKFPKKAFDILLAGIKENKKTVLIAEEIDSNQEIKQEMKNLGHKFETFNQDALYKMIKYFGYKNINHLKEQAENYNHKVVSVEYLPNKIDTGTLTIDGNHELHNYHTFATTFLHTFNSNLGEIDDAVYFRRKVFIALNFPANYMAQEGQDASISRLNLSSVDAKVAKHIERLQGHITDGLMEIATRHLTLRGYPQDLFEDLELKMTCPYPVREFSLNEIQDARYNRAMSVFSSKMYSHFDVLTKLLKHDETEAKEIVARVNAQNLMDLKLQMIAQNPEMMGLTVPQPEGNQIGTDENGPNPQLGQENETPNPEEGESNEEETSAEDTYGNPESAEEELLPEPSDEDIERFDMGLTNYSHGIDAEDIDVSELGDE